MPELYPPPPKRLRIALVHYRDSSGTGGSLRVGEAVAAHLDRRAFDPHIVFAYGGPGPVAASGRIHCHYLNARGPGDPLAWLRARVLLSALEPGVIHYMDAVFWLRAAVLGLDTPSLVHIHGPVVESCLTRRQRWLWRALARITSGHVCVSQGMREAALRHGWSDANRTWVVYNGIDTHHFAQLPNRGAARARFGLPPSAFVLGMLCRLTAGKGCREAIDLLAMLPPRYHLLLCGSGPLRDSLESAAREAGIGDRVHLAGKVDDPRAAYAAMDALLFLSRYETFGLVIAEAMAAGVPVIGLAGDGGYRELPTPLVTPSNSFLIEHPRPADFFAPETPEAIAHLAGHILRVTAGRDVLEDRVANARAWVREHFGIRRQAVSLERLYTDIALPGSRGDGLPCPKARSERPVDSGACRRTPPPRAAVLWRHLGPYHLARCEAVRHLCDLTVMELAASERGCGWDSHRPAAQVRTLTLSPSELREEPRFAAARRVWSALNRLDPGTVFIAGYGGLPFLGAALWCRLHRRRAVLFSDTTLTDRPRRWWREALKGPLVRALFDRAIVGGSRQEAYLESLGFAPRAIDRPYLVVDNDYFRTGAAEFRRGASPADCGLPAGPYFLYVGRLAPEKNLAFLLRAYGAYTRAGGAWDLVLAGDGPLAAELRAACARDGLERRVHFTGTRTGRDLVACYAFASCLVLPSLSEPWGLVLNEAMAAGLPLLVSRHCGSSADLVDSGRNAYAFDPTDEGELALCLARIAELEPDARGSMGAASAAIVEGYSLDAWAAAFARALQP